MEINYKKFSNNLYIYFKGELDECSANDIRKDIDGILDDNLSSDRVVLNLSELHFMDSTGIGFLIGRYKKLKRINTPLYIESPNITIDKILSLSGLYNIMPRI